MKRSYPAIIDKDGNAFGITFPDFPGCISAADSPEEAIQSGAEALSGHIAMMVEDGDPIPPPTPLTDVTWEADEQVVCVTLVAVAIPGRAQRINVTLDESLISEIDAIAPNRSRFLADAARAELARRNRVA